MKKMGGPKRTETQRSRDRARIAFLYLRGTPLPQIHKIVNEEAENYEINYSTVWRDLQWCRLEWQKDAKRSIDSIVAEQLKKIDVLETEYWNAWIKSQEAKRSSSIRSKQLKAKKGKRPKESMIDIDRWEKIEERLGDPRYLDGFFNCIMARLKILGRETPDSEDKAKEAAAKIREAIQDIDSLMDIEPAGK